MNRLKKFFEKKEDVTPKEVVYTDGAGFKAEVGTKKALNQPVYVFNTCGCCDKKQRHEQTIFPDKQKIFNHYEWILSEYNYIWNSCPFFRKEPFVELFISVRKTKPELNDVIEVSTLVTDGRKQEFEPHKPINSGIVLFVDAADFSKLDIESFVQMVVDDAKECKKSGLTMFDVAAHYPVVWNKRAPKDCFGVKTVNGKVEYFKPPQSVCFDKTVKTKNGQKFGVSQPMKDENGPKFN